MLKWTVLSKRDQNIATPRPLWSGGTTTTPRTLAADIATTPTSKSKMRRRRSSATPTRHRRSSMGTRRSPKTRRNSLDALEADKENQFTSTPIKGLENGLLGFEALRDVSNLTPNREQFPGGRRIFSAKKCKSDKKLRTPLSGPRHHHKKKKDCVSSHANDFLNHDSQTSNYFRPFETVDSHIEGILSEDICSCKKTTYSCVKKRIPDAITDTYAPTLPTFASEYSPCEIRTTHCLETLNKNSTKKVQPIVKLLEDDSILPPSKKPKTDHVSDFLHQITFVTSPEVKDTCFPGLRMNSTSKKMFSSDKVTPLVKRFLDFRFNKSISSASKLNNNHNNSSYLNNMSLDQIVDAILDTTDDSIRPTVKRALNTSLIVNVESENENNINESREETFIPLVQRQKNILENISENSSDSGFRSSNTEKSHQLDNNFICKCSAKKTKTGTSTDHFAKEKTIIQMDETYNERCVDEDTALRKRPSPPGIDCTTEKKKPHLDSSIEGNNFTLKRQRCIRRRKPLSVEKSASTIPLNTTSFSMKQLDFESTPIRNCYLENKGILGSSIPAETPIDDIKGLRRCLVFDSPLTNDSNISETTIGSKSGIEVRGSIDLNICSDSDAIFVNVIRCKDLYRPNGDKINAYVKVAISDKIGDNRRKRNAVLQRTAVQGDSTRPQFNHTFKFPSVPEDSQKRVHIEVWHRERATKTSDFLGCMSFDVKNVLKEGITGSFKLLPHTTGRTTNVPITPDNRSECPATSDNARKDTKMCESQSSVEELISLDDLEGELKKSTNKAILSEQQKYADENLFLRYLELDPTEGPDATSAATQRKATGNRNGRTPFTCTKKLTRAPKSGFGFSVVWTHPPRIERVEKGLPADRAGILPGDYIIFVDKHNVVMMPEIDILNLIRSYGSQLTLEIFRRNPSRNGSVPSVKRLSTPLVASATLGGSSVLPVTSVTSSSNLVQRRPSTVCSTNTASVDYNRRKLHLPQVTFSSEKPTSNPDENRKKAMYQLISKEQQYTTGLQFAITRFVSALQERKDLITPAEHRILFQNCEEILRITEDILDQLIQDDGEPHINHLTRTYQSKTHEITTAYKRYCSGIKKADCVLANKTKNSNSDFCRFLQVPAIPRRRPDITTFIHKPLEHYREVLKLLTIIQSNTKPNHDDFPVINQVVHDLQLTYREITSGAGLMEPVGEGRPLLTVQDLENRLVFTKCKPFVLNKPGRQWIFGGDLSRVEGRNVRQYWTLLFSDLLLFAKASRDRVLFITEDPLPLAHVCDMFFNVRKKDTEFRITVSPEGRKATSPTVHCGPDLTRTPRKHANKKTVILRAPTAELKAVWQNLLQRQIFHLNSGMDGSSVSSPIESPEAPITSSVVTLQSAESLSTRRQTPQNLNQNCHSECSMKDIQKQIDALIEHKCKQLGKTSFNSKYNAIHLEKWMKGQLDHDDPVDSPELEPIEEWTTEMLRKRSQELQLIDEEGNIKIKEDRKHDDETRTEEVVFSDHEQSPSKSTTTGSQVTVRSSPLMTETVPVCRQCHKTCLSSSGTMNGSLKNFNDCSSRNGSIRLDNTNKDNNDNENDDWQPLLLLGLMTNPTSTLVQIDPFAPTVPKISVVPATPESSIRTSSIDNKSKEDSCQCQNPNDNQKTPMNNNDIVNENENSPDDSPQTEEHPYHSLSSSVVTLRRFGTVSSLERVGSDEKEDNLDNNVSCKNSDDELDYEDEELDDDEEGGIDNEAFNQSSIRHWTIRAGSYVAEKMAFFERWGEDYRSGAFFDRYLRSSNYPVNGEDQQEEETSGATSGEEIWGTPTSGEMDDTPNSPSYEGKQSPNDGSISSDYGDDTEIMMDELLMTPPISGAMMRGLLPRRTLEPLIEEEGSETSSSSIESTTEPSVSPEQGSETGGVADICSTAAEAESPEEKLKTTEEVAQMAPSPPQLDVDSIQPLTKIHRSESYRHIIEAAEEESDDERNVFFFNRFKPTAKFVNIERVPRSKSIKIFEFFNVRRPERRMYQTFPEGRHLIKVYSKEDEETDDIPKMYSDKPGSPKQAKDKPVDKRFWRQLSRRRGSKVNAPA